MYLNLQYWQKNCTDSDDENACNSSQVSGSGGNDMLDEDDKTSDQTGESEEEDNLDLGSSSEDNSGNDPTWSQTDEGTGSEEGGTDSEDDDSKAKQNLACVFINSYDYMYMCIFKRDIQMLS